MSSFRHRCFGAYAASLSCLPGIAVAQSMPAAGTVASPADRAGGALVAGDAAQAARSGTSGSQGTPDLDAIIVTGTSHHTQLQNAAVSVTAFTARDIERAGVTNPSALLKLTPNVSFDNSMQSESQISIRGIAQTNKPGSNSPVAVVIDGVPIQDASEFAQQLFDIQQIEVLKGPQSALYGRNAIAGAIVINTQPPPDHWAGSAQFGASNGGGLKGKVTIGGPIVEDKILFQLTGLREHSDGLYTNVTTGKKVDFYDETALRGRLLITPSERLTIDLKGEGAFGSNGSFQYIGLITGNPFDPHTTLNVNDTDVPYTPDLKGVYTEQRYKFSDHNTYDLDGATISSTTAYSYIRWHSRGAQYPYLPAADGQSQDTQGAGDTNKSFFQDLRITSDANKRLRYVFGIDGYIYSQRLIYLTGRTSNRTLLHDTGPYPAGSDNPTTTYSNDLDKTRAFGIFGDLAYDLTGKLSLDLALRYDYAHVKSTDQAPLVYSATSGQSRKTRFDQFQPKVTVSYKVTPDFMAFADYGRGFLAGGFNVTGARDTIIATGDPKTSVQDIYPQETADDFEAGFKSQWLDKKLTINGAFFYDLIHNQQLYQFLPFAGLQVIDQIDRVRAVGGEIEIDYKFLHGWDGQVAFGYTDAEITRYPSKPETVGNRAPQVPRYNLAIALNHDFRITDAITGYARIQDTLKGSQYWEAENYAGVKTDKINLVDIRIGVTKDGWSLSGFVSNLFDNRYTENVTPITSEAAAIFLGQKRLYGMELTKRF